MRHYAEHYALVVFPLSELKRKPEWGTQSEDFMGRGWDKWYGVESYIKLDHPSLKGAEWLDCDGAVPKHSKQKPDINISIINFRGDESRARLMQRPPPPL